METFACEIYRYNPETDPKPRMQRFEVPDRFRYSMVLDVLEYLKTQDTTLTFRRSCREGVCGSDGMNLNGKNTLACTTRCNDLLSGKRKLIIRPLPGMPVIRDLVVDLSLFYEHYKSVKPWLINDEPEPAIERLQSPEERERLDGLYECILCACCTSSCPSWWWNPERYAGPAALLWSNRFLEDSRDTGERERLDFYDQDPHTLYRCRDIQNCTYVCPKGLNPMGAISDIRRRMLQRST
ncbi:succinate dehydrogenase iron-sulfur subunit [Gilvimarinus sp. F26214L]|uniref:succinate dehydrogenase iron-sulfur subunit n=1 Tax=Gilvimarinus sp. DZF01 TaxID=3461371 RepID=UPI004045E0A2